MSPLLKTPAGSWSLTAKKLKCRSLPRPAEATTLSAAQSGMVSDASAGMMTNTSTLSRDSKTKPGPKLFEPLCPGKKLRFLFGTYDIETESIEDLTFRMIGFYDGKEYSCFRDLGRFFSHVLTQNFSGWRFFAHFAGRFDVHYLWDWLRVNSASGYQVKEFVMAGSCVIAFTIERGRFHWRFVDSYRLLPAPLRDLTHDFDVEHKKLAFDPSSWIYNRNDCEGLYEVLDKFFSAYGVASETAASHAIRVFRKDFLKNPILIPPSYAENLARKAYTGGRAEVFRWDRAEVTEYDVNSLYPWAMLAPVPTEYLCSSRNLPDSDDSRIGFYEAEITYPDVYLPALPFRTDRLYFPTGHFSGHYSSSELRLAVTDGAAVRIIKGVLFRSEPILRDYVMALHAEKMRAEASGDMARRYITKLLLNSCYGKFGETRYKECYVKDPGTAFLRGNCDLPYHIDCKHGPPVWPVADSGMVWFHRRSQAPHILPQIAAAVTARARERQVGFLRSCPRVWYTDTDSVFTDCEIEAGGELGELARKRSGEFQAFRPKEYELSGKYKVKGVPVTVTNPKTGEKTEDYRLAVLYLQGHEVKFERMAGFMESLNRGLPAARRITVKRQRGNPREKRARDGSDTRPWNVKELMQ